MTKKWIPRFTENGFSLSKKDRFQEEKEIINITVNLKKIKKLPLFVRISILSLPIAIVLGFIGTINQKEVFVLPLYAVATMLCGYIAYDTLKDKLNGRKQP